MSVFKIKPLKWKTHYKTREAQSWSAETSFGSYYINHNVVKGTTWSYCFQEYYDEDQGEAESVQDAKELMEKDWLTRIRPALVRVCA